MTYCNRCGKEVDEGDTFCHACGAAVVRPGGAEDVPPAPGTPPAQPETHAPATAAPAPAAAAPVYPHLMREESPREIAERKVRKRLELWWHLGSYLIVNAFLVIIWAMTGRGYPWFIWVMIGWGIGVAFHVMQFVMGTAVDARRDGMVAREMEKMQRRHDAHAGAQGREEGAKE